MITFVPTELTGPAWETVRLSQTDSIEVAIRRPSLADQLEAIDAGCSSDREFQLRSHIVDWRGVQDTKGQPVPYSWGTLNALCLHYPDAVFSLLKALGRVQDGPTETDQKNSPPPPADGGTATATETTASTPSSDSTPISDGSNDYKTTLD